MKKNRGRKLTKSISIVLVLLLLVVIAVGCGQQPAQQSQSASSDTSKPAASSDAGGAGGKKVGIAIPTSTVNRFVEEADLIEQGLKDLGYEVVGKQVANDDSNTQIQQCKNMLANGANLLIVCPVDKKSSAQIVEDAHAQGVPVISYVRMVGGDLDYYVSEDNEAVGTLIGEYVNENLDGGNVIVLTGDSLDTNAQLYRDTAVEAIQSKIDAGKIKIVADQFCKGWSPEEAVNHTENALTQNQNDIQAVMCTNDGTAGGAIEALTAQNLAGKVLVTGGDCELAAAKRILEGTQTMTILKNKYDISGKAIEVADQILKGEKPTTSETRSNETKDIPAFLVPMTVITKDNIQKELIDSGYFPELAK